MFECLHIKCRKALKLNDNNADLMSDSERLYNKITILKKQLADQKAQDYKEVGEWLYNWYHKDDWVDDTQPKPEVTSWDRFNLFVNNLKAGKSPEDR